MTLNIVGHRGPSLPVGINRARRVGDANSKADPVWDTAFTTKFPKNKPAPEAPLVTPRGAARVIQNFLDRASEIAYLQETQHLELATTLSEMKANGIDAFSLSSSDEYESLEAANIADIHLKKTPYALRLPDAHICADCKAEGVAVLTDGEEHCRECGGEVVDIPRYGDMVYVANMKRRIDWERYIWGCGPIHRVRFDRTKDNALGIAYEGREKDPEVILNMKRAMKARWLETHDALPSYEDIAHAGAHLSHLGKPVLALLDEHQHDEYLSSKMYGTEDPDPERVGFHAEPDPKPQRDQYPFGDCRACSDALTDHPNHRNCTILGWDMYHEDVTKWEARQTDRGYAGPAGLLGLDDVSSSLVIDIE